jgi:hypothetical protein
VVIDPKRMLVDFTEVFETNDAYPLVGLVGGKVDFGTLARDPDTGITYNIIVYEFGLYVPPEHGHYFSIGSSLYEGGAILFAADHMGETVSYPATKPPVQFYRSGEEVEAAIQRREINRPYSAINGEVIWQWPSHGQFTEQAIRDRLKEQFGGSL